MSDVAHGTLVCLLLVAAVLGDYMLYKQDMRNIANNFQNLKIFFYLIFFFKLGKIVSEDP